MLQLYGAEQRQTKEKAKAVSLQMVKRALQRLLFGMLGVVVFNWKTSLNEERIETIRNKGAVDAQRAKQKQKMMALKHADEVTGVISVEQEKMKAAGIRAVRAVVVRQVRGNARVVLLNWKTGMKDVVSQLSSVVSHCY